MTPRLTLTAAVLDTPDPQWMTTGVPLASSCAQTSSSSGSRGSKRPTCTCTLNTRAPRAIACPT